MNLGSRRQGVLPRKRSSCWPMVSGPRRHHLQVRPSSSGGSTSEGMTIRHHARQDPSSCTPRSVLAPSSDPDPGRVDPASKVGGPGIEAYKFEFRGTGRGGPTSCPRSRATRPFRGPQAYSAPPVRTSQGVHLAKREGVKMGEPKGRAKRARAVRRVAPGVPSAAARSRLIGARFGVIEPSRACSGSHATEGRSSFVRRAGCG